MDIKDAKEVNAPEIPNGLPPTDPTKPKWSLTQDQIDWLSEQIPSIWPAFKIYWPIIVMLAAGFGIGGFGAGRGTAPIEKTPPVVVVAPVPGGDVIIPPTTKKLSITLFTTAAVDAKKIATDPALTGYAITVDAKIYAEGSAYPVGNRTILLPCAIVLGNDGKAVDGVHFTKVEDIVEFAKKKGN